MKFSTFLGDMSTNTTTSSNSTIIDSNTTSSTLLDSIEAYQSQKLNRLWLVIGMVSLIILTKFLFRSLIADKPRWVTEEEERQRAEKDANKGISETKAFPAKAEKEIMEEKKKNKGRLDNMRNLLDKTNKKMKEIEVEKEKLKQKLKEKTLASSSALGLSNFQQNSQEFKGKVLSLFLRTYKNIEQELLVLRLEDIAKFEGNYLFLCNECHKAKAVLECLDCEDNYCKKCYDDVHVITHKMLGKTLPVICGLAKGNLVETLNGNDYKFVDRAKFIRDQKIAYFLSFFSFFLL